MDRSSHAYGKEREGIYEKWVVELVVMRDGKVSKMSWINECGMVIRLWQAAFKKSTESDMTQPSRIRLEADCDESDTRYLDSA